MRACRFPGAVNLDDAHLAARSFVLAALRVLHLAPFLPPSGSATAPSPRRRMVGGEWPIEGVAAGVGADEKSQTDPLGELGEHVVFGDLQILSQLGAAPGAMGNAAQQGGDPVTAGRWSGPGRSCHGALGAHRARRVQRWSSGGGVCRWMAIPVMTVEAAGRLSSRCRCRRGADNASSRI